MRASVPVDAGNLVASGLARVRLRSSRKASYRNLSDRVGFAGFRGASHPSAGKPARHKTALGLKLANKPASAKTSDQAFLLAALTLRWRSASNRHTPVATETLRLLTLPAIGRRTR